jgi:hypothetical protein
MGAVPSARVDCVIHIHDDSFEYPVGLRLRIHHVRGGAAGARVELDPHGTHRVVGCERTRRGDAPLLRLGLQRVFRPMAGRTVHTIPGI